MKKLFALILTTLLVATMAVSAFASEAGACKGIVPKVEAGSVVVDGVKDAAYENALCVDINQFLSAQISVHTARLICFGPTARTIFSLKYLTKTLPHPLKLHI